ncbi:MAG: efflux RND transporter permease subunit [Alphaproteobacteria bacterium]
MDIARSSIKKPVNTWLLMIICLLGGIYGFFNIGRLEDPEFTIKSAIVITLYPGASPKEVEKEVTEKLESAIQQLPQIDKITSKSSTGYSEITVEIRDEYDGTELPQVWDELRRKVNDVKSSLPSGVQDPIVNDDYGDVYGIFYAITGDGYTRKEIQDFAKVLRRKLLMVTGVGKVSIAGDLTEEIFVEISARKISQLKISASAIFQTLQAQNLVSDSGSIKISDDRIKIRPSGNIDSVEAIENLQIGVPGEKNLFRLGDIANVTRGFQEVPNHLVRFNGKEALTIGVSGVSGVNIVDVGNAVEAKLEELQTIIPIGIKLSPIYEQHKVVDAAVNGFVTNLVESVIIVVAVLCLTMGWRSGVVIGIILFLTVMGTIFFMKIFGIDMERISLGALIIAMGMLVDNAIVVAEGMMVGVNHGKNSTEAASEVVKQTMVPLLGATIVAVMAFSGIGLSQDSTGEFCFSLFAVVGISLLLSWVFAVFVTPLLGSYFFVEGEVQEGEAYNHSAFMIYKRFLIKCLKHRKLTVLTLLLFLVMAVVGFGFVKQAFFPDSSTPIFYIDYWRKQGTDIAAVKDDVVKIEKFIMQQEGFDSVSSFIGRGATRFMLVYTPEQTNSSYSQFIVRTTDKIYIEAFRRKVEAYIEDKFPQAMVYTKRVAIGPSSGAKIEARITGQDADVLREYATKIEEIFYSDGKLQNIKHNWRHREKIIVPVFSEERGRKAGISRQDLSQSLLINVSGETVGVYREKDNLLPIVVRSPLEERLSSSNIENVLIYSSGLGSSIPISQVVESFETKTEDGIIARRNRERTLTVMADPLIGENTMSIFSRVRPQIEKLELPMGYHLEWGGEYENSRDAQASLGSNLPLSFAIMIVIVILLFGKVKQPLIIWLTVPFAIIGVTFGLLVSGVAFNFMALLGFLSLSGMLIKNAVVLIDEIDTRIASGKNKFSALVDGSVSRLRPVSMAALTTILGMAPLIFDDFFAGMAVTIMGGLTFATILTMIVVPVFYASFFNIKER